MLSNVDTSSVVSITISEPTSQRTRKLSYQLFKEKKNFCLRLKGKMAFRFGILSSQVTIVINDNASNLSGFIAQLVTAQSS